MTEFSKELNDKFNNIAKMAMQRPHRPPPDHKIWFNFPPSYPAIAFIEFSAVAFKNPLNNIKTKAIFNPVWLGIVIAIVGSKSKIIATSPKVTPILVMIVNFLARG